MPKKKKSIFSGEEKEETSEQADVGASDEKEEAPKEVVKPRSPNAPKTRAKLLRNVVHKGGIILRGTDVSQHPDYGILKNNC